MNSMTRDLEVNSQPIKADSYKGDSGSSHLVEGIEQAWRDREAGLGVGALYRFQGGLVRIEDDTA